MIFCSACLFSKPSNAFGVNSTILPVLLRSSYRSVFAEGSRAGQCGLPCSSPLILLYITNTKFTLSLGPGKHFFYPLAYYNSP